MDATTAPAESCHHESPRPKPPPSLPPKPKPKPLTSFQNHPKTANDSDDPPPLPPLQLPPPVPSRASSTQLSQTYMRKSNNKLQSSTRSPSIHSSTLPHHQSAMNPQTSPGHKDMLYEAIQASKREQLSDIVTDSSLLPMRVAFCDSIYGICGSFTFASNELFDVHFLKESQFANACISNGKQVKIPLQAPFQFTLEYSSSSICDAEYKIPQLMKLTHLPTVGVVKGGSSNSRSKFRSNKSSEFVQGEILIFKSRIKSSTIECFSLSQKETKRIHKSSELTLITNPSRSTFDFTDLIFFDVPLQVQIQTALPKLQPKFRSISAIKSLTKEKSLITSFSDAKINDDDDYTNIPLYEIFIDAPIDFQRAYTLPAEKQSLIQKSETIFRNFSPLYVKRVVPNVNNNHFQEQLYNMLTYPGNGGEQWRSVTEFIKPSTFDQKLQKKEQEVPLVSPPLPDETSDGEYDTVDLTYSYMSPLSSTPPAQSSHSGDSSTNSTIATRSLSFQLPLSDPPPNTDSHQMLKSQNDKNVTQQLKLMDLSCDQVLDLLDKLGLSKYKNLFIEEKISGKLLQELDEEMLEQDLGITSKLHRLKLKRVIEGRESLDDFFQ